MFPTLFRIPGLNWPINSYGFCIMIGFLLCSWVAVKRAKPLGIKSDFILDLGIISMIAGIIGAKINYILQYHKEIEELNKALDLGRHGPQSAGRAAAGADPLRLLVLAQ